jgi:hypothetical protein
MDAAQAGAVRRGIFPRRSGRPIEALKGTSATLKTVLAAAERGEHGELLSEIAREAADDARQHKNPFGGFKPTKGATVGVEILDELRAVNGIVSEKASAEDAAAVRAWLLDAAQAAANAAKEGGFMGFRATRVSEGEKDMPDRVRSAVGA